MYHITVVDTLNVLSNELDNTGLWKRYRDFILTEPVTCEENAQEMFASLKTNVAFIAANGRQPGEIKLVNLIRQNSRGILFVLAGEDRSYEYVRSAFLTGALDYLARPVCLSDVVKTADRICTLKIGSDAVFKAVPEAFPQKGNGVKSDFAVSDSKTGHMKSETFLWDCCKEELLVENLFSEDGADIPLICGDLIDTIYGGISDALTSQMAAKREKEHIYRILIKRKPWLEKFLIAGKYIYTPKFRPEPRDEIKRQWIRDFTRIGKVIHKYHMIDYKLVYPIGKYIVVHVDEKLCLEKISGDIFLSRNYISNIFKKYVGMSVVDFIKEVKIDRAKVLLTDKSRRVCDISNQLHFNDPEYFTKIFRQKSGMTPTQYRNQ